MASYTWPNLWWRFKNISLEKMRYIYCICVTAKVGNWSCFGKREQLSECINCSSVYTSTKTMIICLFEPSTLYFLRGIIAWLSEKLYTWISHMRVICSRAAHISKQIPLLLKILLQRQSWSCCSEQAGLANVHPSSRAADRSLINGIANSGFLFANISQANSSAIIALPFVPLVSLN